MAPVILLLSALLSLSGTVSAEQQQEECYATYCLESGDVDFSLAIGYGQRSNPLNFSENRSLIIVPDFAWYGESWYLDNTEIGYQWIQKQDFAFETFVALNTTNRDFQDDHGSSFSFDSGDVFSTVGESLASDSGSSGDEESAPGAPTEGGELEDGRIGILTDLAVSPEDVGDRDYAIDIGIRAHWYMDDIEWTAALLHDASNTYKGAQMALGFRKMWRYQDWKVVANIGLTWKSTNLLDYYYGIDSTDIENPLFHYDASAGWFTSVGLIANRKISENWHGLIHLSYTHLPDAMTDSPLVEEEYTTTTFAGVTYRF